MEHFNYLDNKRKQQFKLFLTVHFNTLYDIYNNIFTDNITDRELNNILDKYPDFYSKDQGENNFNIIDFRSNCVFNKI